MGLFGGPGGFLPSKAPGRQNTPLGVIHEATVSVPHVFERRQGAAPIENPPAPAPPSASASAMPVPGAPPAPAPAAVPEPAFPASPEVSWYGIIHGYSGYAKANREIVRRIASFVRVSFPVDMPWDRAEGNPEAMSLLDVHRNIGVSPLAPRVTFYPPKAEGAGRVRVIYTMMETDPVHQKMIDTMNRNYDECWTPTQWNAGTFRRSGLRMPIHVMPLGVDTAIYSPMAVPLMPEARLLTTKDAGRTEVPKGFLFIYVFQPSFRKGLDVLVDAFEEAFHDDSEAGLILGTTGYLCDGEDGSPFHSRIWMLSGRYSEAELASIYRACQVYVSTSRGEGWDLPAHEAAACGLPVVVSRIPVHSELIPEDCGFFFDPDTSGGFSEARDWSEWFGGIPFPDFSPVARSRLARLLKEVKANYASAKEKGNGYTRLVRASRTWDLSAINVANRISELCCK